MSKFPRIDKAVRYGVCAAAGSIMLGSIWPAMATTLDWPRWRGPNGDGISTDSNWNPEAITSGPNVVWKTNVGKGWSSVSIRGRYLYTMGNDGRNDIVYCLDGGTGVEIWRYSYPCQPGSYPGPRATPVIDGDLLYTMSREGHVVCLEAATGKLKWQQHLANDHSIQNLKWGFSASVLIHGKLAVCNAGDHGVAFDKTTGKVAWISGKGIGGYATPVPFTINRRTGLAVFAGKGIHGVDPATGRVLWSHPWETRHDVNAADPIFHDGRVFISSGYDRGCALLDVRGDRPKVVWEHRDMRNHFSSCVLLDGHLYGIDGNAGRGQLKCLDFRTGSEKWSEDLGFGSLIAADNKLIVLNERGQLFIAEASPNGYREIARCEALPSRGATKCWTPPVLCKGRIFCRNSDGELVSIHVGK